jgi:hypothetical protein
MEWGWGDEETPTHKNGNAALNTANQIAARFSTTDSMEILP